jgi:long-chain-fatty-acid--[acyl-carrier-protein] ligase
MINYFLALFVQTIFRLRYRVRICGLAEILGKDRRGILFLPNHPALIDPIILVSRLYEPFKVRALADRDQIDRFFIRRLARRVNVLPIPGLDRVDTSSATEVRKTIVQCVEALRNGDNLILYPAGRARRQHLEEISGTSAVESILRELPDVRIVLIRTRGLWGSRFSWACGYKPLVVPTLWKGLKALLLSGIFFTPRREVNIELIEPDNLPRNDSRKQINKYLENFYNENAEHNTYVPYTIWESGGIRQLPEPEKPRVQGDPRQISPATRKLVTQCLEKATGTQNFKDDSQLARDLGMDSLAIVDLILWIETEFGFSQIDVDSLQTVGDVMLAACGEAVSAGEKTLQKIPPKWFQKVPLPGRPDRLSCMTITEAFLAQAQKNPDRVVIADQTSGLRTYRDVITAIIVLKQKIEELPGQHIGIMLPASVGVCVLYLATLFAGKIPVMVNWTLGKRNLLHSLNSVDVQHILTAHALITRIQSQGIELDDIGDRFVCLEDISKKITIWTKVRAWLSARVALSKLKHPNVTDTAVILFTSGSETTPKAVPLTHQNILTNISDSYEFFTITGKDSMLGILPPFHSFGLTTSMLLPLCLGLRVVYYPNPTHGGALGRMIDAYKLSILVGTPTFLHGIARASTKQQLASLRLVVSGAEKCPARVFEAVSVSCPQTVVLEGYGVTECSPIISANHEDNTHPGTVGKVMSSLEYVIVDPETNQRVPMGQKGMLLVRGPSVFSGYLNYEGPSPFIKFEGKDWYRTGDLVTEDEQGILTFSGRLKRFIKLGGEMISLPAIESVLEPQYTSDDDEGPVLAVVATPVEEHPEIILFTVKDIKRESANRIIRDAGLSGLHNIRRILRVDSLPLLGTGKTDYKKLTAIAAESGPV